MRRTILAMLILLAAAVSAGAPALAADPPVLLASNPADGSLGIPPRLGGILLVFDRAMDRGSHSFVLSDQGEFPPLQGDGEWFNDRTFFLPVKGLVAGRTYAVGVNSERHQGFRSAEGVPLAPTSVRFTVAEGFPVVLGSEPNTGETGIDAATEQVVVHFSEDVKVGRMSLIRLAGTAPLGYIPGKDPFLKEARTLVIPVSLAGDTTYGVGVNGPGREGFVSAASGKPVQPFQIVFTTGAGRSPPPPPSPSGGGLVGHWKHTAPDGEVEVELNADGTYRYHARGPDGEDRTKGTWSAADGKLTIREEGKAEPLVVAYRLESEDRLSIDLEGDWIPFERVGADRPPPPPPPGRGSVAGSWYWYSDTGEVTLVLFEDGRYLYRGRSGEAKEVAKGSWSLQGNELVIREDGAGEPIQVPFRLVDADTLEVELEGERIPLKRQEAGESVPEENRLRGSILFTRYEVRKLPAGSPVPEIVLPKMYCLYFGKFKTNGVWSTDAEDTFTTVQDPWWSPDGQTILCASDFANWESALFMDVFTRQRQGPTFKRITGNSRTPAETGKTGSIKYKVTDVPGKGRRKFQIGWQGLQGKSKGQKGEGGGIIEGVPAGKLWVKFYISKHEGYLEVVDVPAGGVVSVEADLAQGNYLASYPSITPDGQYMVCLSQHAFYGEGDPRRTSGGLLGEGDDGEFDRLPTHQGLDTIAAVRTEDGQLVAVWEPTKNGGAFAKDPRLSPDGRWIAFAMGLPGMEALAVMSLESFLRGKPEPRVLVPGDRVLGQGTWGNVAPAWSPDGRQLVFVRYFMTANVKGNLCVVDLEGGAFRQLTNLAQNQCPTYPTWSPYDEGIAFQLITSKGPSLDVLDLARLNVTSDICVIGVDGKNPRRLTNDGLSGQPAWGLYPE